MQKDAQSPKRADFQCKLVLSLQVFFVAVAGILSNEQGSSLPFSSIVGAVLDVHVCAFHYFHLYYKASVFCLIAIRNYA